MAKPQVKLEDQENTPPETRVLKGVSSKKRNIVNRGKEEKLVMDDTKQVKEAFDQTLKDLPKTRINDFLDAIQTFAENAKHEPIIKLPNKKSELKALGIELYPDFKKRTGEANGLKCLKENYAPWLKHKDCTPSLNRDHMSQADLGKLDPQLLARLRALYDADKLNEIIPNENLLNIQIAATISKADKKEITKKHNIIYRHEIA